MAAGAYGQWGLGRPDRESGRPQKLGGTRLRVDSQDPEDGLYARPRAGNLDASVAASVTSRAAVSGRRFAVSPLGAGQR
jgi:hypothetical protein